MKKYIDSITSLFIISKTLKNGVEDSNHDSKISPRIWNKKMQYFVLNEAEAGKKTKHYTSIRDRSNDKSLLHLCYIYDV